MIFSYIIEDNEENPVADFDYEVENDIIDDVLADILLRYDKDELIEFIIDGCTADDFYDELKEYFEKQALEDYYEQR